MPVTIRTKPQPPSDQKDAVSTPPAAGKVELKPTSSRVAGKSTGADGTKSEKASRSTESPKSPVSTKPDSSISSRQRARDRRRGKPELSPDTDSPSPDAATASGRIRNLAGFWSTPKDEVQVVRRKRLEIADHTEKVKEESDSDDSDDLDSIKRAQEPSTADREQIEIEKGMTKSIASMWQNRKNDDQTSTKKKPFRLDIKTEEPTVFENEPVVLEGVIRSEDHSVKEEIVLPRPGRIKDMAVNFANISSQPREDSDEEGTSEKHSSVTTSDKIVETGRIRNVRERWKKRQQKSSRATADDSSSEAESSGDSSSTEASTQKPTPRGSIKDKVIEQAKIRNLRDKWTRRQDSTGEKEDVVPTRAGRVPLHALVTAKEYGVFENEPVVRDDVVRADDETPDIISCERTKKLRKMWTMMEKETTKVKDKDSKPEEVVRTKKKEEKQEPEVTAQAPTSKAQRAASGRIQANKETAKVKEEGKPGKGQKSSGREPEPSKPAQQQQPSDGKGKLQKSFTVATSGTSDDSKPSGQKSPSLTRISSSRKKNMQK